MRMNGKRLCILSQSSLCVVVFLPPVDDFKLDAFGLDDSFEAPVASADVEFEILFKLGVVGALYRARFVPLSLLLRAGALMR